MVMYNFAYPPPFGSDAFVKLWKNIICLHM